MVSILGYTSVGHDRVANHLTSAANGLCAANTVQLPMGKHGNRCPLQASSVSFRNSEKLGYGSHDGGGGKAGKRKTEVASIQNWNLAPEAPGKQTRKNIYMFPSPVVPSPPPPPPPNGMGPSRGGGGATMYCPTEPWTPPPPNPTGGAGACTKPCYLLTGGRVRTMDPPPIPQEVVRLHCATFLTEHDHWGRWGWGPRKTGTYIYIYIYVYACIHTQTPATQVAVYPK